MTSKKSACSSVFAPLLCASLLAATALSAVADDDPPAARTHLKVCADPNYLPFSNKDLSGYENRIASLIGEELKIPVEYTWFPQRLGFIRNTLRMETDEGNGYLCDLVIGVPKEFEMGMASKPYMQSTYALVTVSGGKLADLAEPGDLFKSERDGVKIGVTERSPGAAWLAKYGKYLYMEPYIAQSGDPDEYPGKPMYDDLLAGKIDAAIVFGPTAAYFANRPAGDKQFKVLPLQTEAGVRFHFALAMGVRFGEDEWRDQINQILEKDADKIQQILKEYHVPLVNDAGELLPS